MRVIAGIFKGRAIEAPKKAKTRPATDRAREGVFNTLTSMGGIEDLTGVDLFAGSGSFGIEALSRGAANITFVDYDEDAIKTVEKNLEKLGASNGKARKSDVLRFVKSMDAVDVAFIDPPFAMLDDDWAKILANLAAELVVAESNRDISSLFPATYPDLRVRTYGDSVVVIARRSKPVDER